MTLYIAILGIVFVIGIIKKNSNIATLAMVFLMWLLISNNFYNADYQMYVGYYYKYGISTTLYNTEILFQLMCKVSYSLNLPYETFLKFYFLIALFFIYMTIKKISKNKFLALACYFVFPFFLDAVQIRHLMAIALVGYGFACLMNDKKGEKKYLLFNILALGFHFNAVFYLPIILVKKINIKKIIIPFLCIIAVATLIIRSNFFIELLTLIIPADKVYAYFISNEWNSGFKGFIIFGGLQLLTVLVMAIVYYITKDNTKEKTQLKYVLTANILLLIVLPLYTFTIEFTRVFRGFMLINYIYILNSQDNYLSKNNLLRKVLLYATIAILFYFLIIYLGILEKTIINIFEFNNLFK